MNSSTTIDAARRRLSEGGEQPQAELGKARSSLRVLDSLQRAGVTFRSIETSGPQLRSGVLPDGTSIGFRIGVAREGVREVELGYYRFNIQRAIQDHPLWCFAVEAAEHHAIFFFERSMIGSVRSLNLRFRPPRRRTSVVSIYASGRDNFDLVKKHCGSKH